MKLLLDQNLSRRLVSSLAEAFPGSSHVVHLGLDRADDSLIWERAKREGFAIVTKDSDFLHRSTIFGHPPKIVWIARGNCSSSQVGSLLLKSVERLREFFADSDSAFLVME